MFSHADEEGDMDVHDRGMLYYRLLKHNVHEAKRVVCGQHKVVASKNTIIPRVSLVTYMYLHHNIMLATPELQHVLYSTSKTDY